MCIDCFTWIDEDWIMRTLPPGFRPKSAIDPASSVCFNSTTDYGERRTVDDNEEQQSTDPEDDKAVLVQRCQRE